jgi:hypothetical protein
MAPEDVDSIAAAKVKDSQTTHITQLLEERRMFLAVIWAQ